MSTNSQMLTNLSRSKLELLFDCPRCFWLYVGKGINRPSSAPYTINNAIDTLLKQEFDVHRKAGTPHPIIQSAGLDAVPYKNPSLEQWRHPFTGIQFDDLENHFHIFGAVDDLWVNNTGDLIVIDYKATGNREGELYDSYKRQMEIYQWLLRRNNFAVSDTAYFVYCRVDYDAGFVEGKLTFDIKLQSYLGHDSWIIPTLQKARQILDSPIPPAGPKCQYCKYQTATFRLTSQPSLYSS